jgi:hypothetical protein
MPRRNTPSLLKQRTRKTDRDKRSGCSEIEKQNSDKDETSSRQKDLQRVLVVATQKLSLVNERIPSGETNLSLNSTFLLSKSNVPSEASSPPVVFASTCNDDVDVNGKNQQSDSGTSVTNQVKDVGAKAATDPINELGTSKRAANAFEEDDRNGYEQDSTAVDRLCLFIKSNRIPSDFFNLARKFLAKSVEIDLIAMETAIIVAVDTANLLERSKYATICR